MPKPHVRKYTTPEELTSAIVAKFQWMESMDLRIARIWMHPADIALINKNLAAFDRIYPGHPIQSLYPDMRGRLFGNIIVSETSLFPEEHIVLLQDGFDTMGVKLLDPQASIPL